MKKIIIIVSIVLVLAIGATAALFFFKAPPATSIEKIEDAFEKSATALAIANADTISKNKEFSSSGSVEISADLGQLMKYSGMDMDLDAMFKLYMDSENSKFAEELNLSINNQTIIDALLALNEKNIAIKSDTILGKNAYGITFADFFDKFDSSVFGPSGAYSLDITAEELKENITELMKSAYSTSLYNTTNPEAYTYSNKIIEDFKDVIKTSISANATFAEADGTLVIAGNEIHTTDVSINFTEEQAITVGLDILKYFRNSETFKEAFMLVAHEMGVYSTGESIGIGSPGLGVDDYLDFITTDPDEVYADYMELIDELIEEGNALLEEKNETASEDEIQMDEDNKVNFTLTFHISKDNDELIGVTLIAGDKEFLANVELKFGPSMADIDHISIAINGDDLTDSMEPDTYSFEYIVSEDSASKYKASACLSSVEYYDWDGEVEEYANSLDLTIEWDKKVYDYKLDVNLTEYDEKTKLTLGGTYKPEEDCETITITTVGTQGIKFNIGEIKVVTRYNDTVPEISEFNEVLDMTEEDVDKLVETFEEFAAMIEMYLN